jgi:hypothetical protein
MSVHLSEIKYLKVSQYPFLLNTCFCLKSKVANEIYLLIYVFVVKIPRPQEPVSVYWPHYQPRLLYFLYFC